MALARGFDPTVDLRLQAASEAAAQMPSDVVCLQEVWTQEDLDVVKSVLWSNWHDVHFSFEQDEPQGIPCDTGAYETEDFLDCVADECSDADDLATCILVGCLEELNDLDGECKNCLIANSGSDDLFETCTTTPASSFFYGGHNGLVLAAKFPIQNIMFMEFDSHLQQTGVLYGEVLEAQIACTHLNSDYPGIDYAGKFGSWDGQNLFEAKLVLGLMKSFENGSPQVILGDMNSGPAIPEAGIAAERPETYEKFIEKGFHSANVISPSPFCTWCPDNNNLIPDPEDEPSIIDHVFVKNADSNNPKRFWDFQRPFNV